MLTAGWQGCFVSAAKFSAGVVCCFWSVLVFAPEASAAATVSSNWAGYVSVPKAGSGQHFSSVSGAWTAPSASCTGSEAAYSAVWVGLGGYVAHSKGLEQIGTDADCSRAGKASYSTWYELLPAAPVYLRLKTAPGDRVVASVTAHEHRVTLRIRDVSTGARFSVTRRLSKVDASSADWIVEAPSQCVGTESCSALALANFGTVGFSAATATSGGHTGPVNDNAWSDRGLELRQEAVKLLAGREAGGPAVERSVTTATATAPAGPLGLFCVSWGQTEGTPEEPTAPTLPGFNRPSS